MRVRPVREPRGGAGGSEEEGFEEEEFEDERVEGAQAFHGADLAEAFHDGHEHGVGDAHEGDEKREGEEPDGTGLAAGAGVSRRRW